MKEPIYKKYGALLLCISGIISALPLIFSEIGFIQWVSIAPAAYVLTELARDREVKLSRIYLAALLFFESYFLVIFHWFLAMYPLEFTGISKGAAVFVVALAWIGVSLIQALVYALAFFAFGALVRLRNNEKISAAFLMPLAAAALFTVFEWIQTLDWWGVPWGRLCLGQVNAIAFFGSASVLGSYFVSFCIVAVNFFLAFCLTVKDKKQTLCAVCALCVFLLNLSLGIAADMTYRDGDKTVRVAAVQGNNPNSNVWNEESLPRVLEVHERLTCEAAKEGAEIIVWSETAFPLRFFKTNELYTRVSKLAVETGATILVSAFTESQEEDVLYVSIIEAKPDGSFGEVIYSKQRLVPFGEFVPMRELVVKLIPPLAQLKTLEDGIVAGDESCVLYTDHAAIGAAICYDSIFEEVLRSSVNNGAELLVVSTNDSWFGTSAALKMHNSQAVLRSVETGRYVVRSANTGISSISSPRGEIMQKLDPAIEGYIVSDVAINSHTTPYMTIGNLFVYICIDFCLILGIFDGARFIKVSKTKPIREL